MRRDVTLQEQPPHYPIVLAPRMLPTDALFWYVEDANPEIRLQVGGLLMLDRAPDRKRYRASIHRLIRRLPRLQERVVEVPLDLPRWEVDAHFDLDYHLRDAALSPPTSERHLLDFLGTAFAAPLDHLRPPWEAYLVEGLDGGRAAFFFKAHHSLIDGKGSLAVLEALTQAAADEPVSFPRRARPRRGPAEPAVTDLARERLWSTAAGLGRVWNTAATVTLRPSEVINTALQAYRGVRGLMSDLSAPAIVDPLVNGSTGVGRRLDAVAFPLSRMLRIKEALGITLNDLVLTAAAGAIGRYREYRQAPVETLRCVMPVSLRGEHERHLLGNRVGMSTVMLPVAEVDPLRRLERIRRQTVQVKGDRRAAVFPVLLQALPFVPRIGFRALANSGKGRAGLLCSNMPGPSTPRFLADARVEVIYPFAPLIAGTPLSLALLSYDGTYGIGIGTDPAVIPDPHVLRDYLCKEVDAIERIAISPVSRGSRRRRTPAHVNEGKPLRKRGGAADAARHRST